MATWRSSEFKYEDSHIVGGNFRFRWEYQTTADSLMIINENDEGSCAYGFGVIKPNKHKYFFGPEAAHALYKCLRNWLIVYEGEKTLERLDKEESDTRS